MKRLEGRVVLVTGGAVGLGKAIAQRLASEGAQIVITDVQVDLGRTTADECGLRFMQQDVCDEARWSEVVTDVEHRFGKLDVLVNNAGILGPMKAVDPESASLSDWRRIFAVNVEGVFLGCRAAIPAMRRAGGGSIVNLSSVAGLSATPYATAYGASKAAVRQLTRSVAQYCAEQRIAIRCNSVHPGDVMTPLWLKHAEESAAIRGISAQQVVAEVEAQTPSGKLTQPQDVAGAVAFLASDDARAMTGEQLIVDGGYIQCNTFRAPHP